jgi:hypothetical protein
MAMKNPALIGIILDVSSSMRTNWKNQAGKHAPRFDVVKDALNEQIWKLAALQGPDYGETEIFCLGMGFRRAVTYVGVDLRNK